MINELRNRGVNDVLLFAVDGLTGFSEAIHTVYPDADMQRCIVHQVRNFLNQMAWKDKKEVAGALRSTYTAHTEEAGLMELDNFEKNGDINIPRLCSHGREISRN